MKTNITQVFNSLIKYLIWHLGIVTIYRSKKDHVLFTEGMMSQTWIEGLCEELVEFEFRGLLIWRILQTFCLGKMGKYFRTLILEEII